MLYTYRWGTGRPHPDDGRPRFVHRFVHTRHTIVFDILTQSLNMQNTQKALSAAAKNMCVPALETA